MEDSNKGESGQIALIGLMLLLLVIVAVGIALDATMLSKITPKLLALGNPTSNATMALAVSRGYTAVDFGGIALPIAIALGFIIFMVLWIRRAPEAQQ